MSNKRYIHYAHLSGVDVKKGDKVKLGHKIGDVGKSGLTPGAGAHLHFEVTKQKPVTWTRYTKGLSLDQVKELYDNPHFYIQEQKQIPALWNNKSAGWQFLQWTGDLYHPGVDINSGYGDQDLGNDVKSVSDGVVIFVGSDTGWGNHVWIESEVEPTTQNILVITHHAQDNPHFVEDMSFLNNYIDELTGGMFKFNIDYLNADDRQFDIYQFTGISGYYDEKKKFYAVQPGQLVQIGIEAEKETGKEYDVVSFVYNPKKVSDKVLTAIHNPITIHGFTVTQVSTLSTSGKGNLAEFFMHELLHAWYYILKQRGVVLEDRVHESAGVTFMPGSYGDIILNLKPYWHLLTEAKQDIILKKKKMLTYKLQGKPAVYFAVGNTLIPFATDWETYLLDFKDAVLVELTPSEFNKFVIAQAVQVTKK